MKVERSISIERPPGDVFDFVADVRNDPTWHTDVLDVRTSTEQVAPGTVFTVKVKPSMGVSGGTMTVANLEPGRRVQFEGRMGKMAPTVTNSCEPEGSGTRFTRSVQLEPPGVMKFFTPLIKLMIGKSNEGFLRNLKRVLEGAASKA
jgi:carbon monoxide dehydrogenase subunit G